MHPCAAEHWQGAEAAGRLSPTGVNPKPIEISGMLGTICGGL